MTTTIHLLIIWGMRILALFWIYQAFTKHSRLYEIELIKKSQRIDGKITSRAFGVWLPKTVTLTDITGAELEVQEYDDEDSGNTYTLKILCKQGKVITGDPTLKDNTACVEPLNQAIERLQRVGGKMTVPLTPKGIWKKIIINTITLTVFTVIAFMPKGFLPLLLA